MWLEGRALWERQLLGSGRQERLLEARKDVEQKADSVSFLFWKLTVAAGLRELDPVG